MKSGIFILTIAFVLSLTSCVWENPNSSLEFLPLDDSEYTYAGLPRLVLETDDFQEIRNKQDKIPARMQLWGKDSPISEIKNLTIKGRGFSSWTMAKYGIKLNLNEKCELLGMPKNKDWDLVPNLRDKTHLRNYITYRLASLLGPDYSPKCKFVEVFLNRRYLGLYLLVEHVKVDKNRVHFAGNDFRFLIEKTQLEGSKKKTFQSSLSYMFEIHFPKDVSDNILCDVKNVVDSLENALQDTSSDISKWIDINNFVRYYWVQEFSKNIDGGFGRSIFISWENGGVFKLGPVWDFDLAYGIGNTSPTSPEDWHVRYQGWHKLLFKRDSYKRSIGEFWKQNYSTFAQLLDTIPAIQDFIKTAVENDEKRWPILNENNSWPFVESYPNYDAAVDSLKSWIKKRISWISNQYQ